MARFLYKFLLKSVNYIYIYYEECTHGRMFDMSFFVS